MKSNSVLQQRCILYLEGSEFSSLLKRAGQINKSLKVLRAIQGSSTWEPGSEARIEFVE